MKRIALSALVVVSLATAVGGAADSGSETYTLTKAGRTVHLEVVDRFAGGFGVHLETNGVAGLQKAARAGDLLIVALPGPVHVQMGPGRNAGPELERALRRATTRRANASPIFPGLAACEFDGSVPGTAAKTYPVSAGGQTIYVDDRDYADANDDGVAGGIWLYYESNKVGGLQRGGDQVVVGMIPGTVPFIPPTPITTPGVGPVGPRTITLFPNGFGGGSVAQATGWHDPCTDSATPDAILF